MTRTASRWQQQSSDLCLEGAESACVVPDLGNKVCQGHVVAPALAGLVRVLVYLHSV